MGAMSDDPQRTCSFCGAVFTSRSKLFLHLRGSSCTEKAAASGLEVSPSHEKVALVVGCNVVDSEWRASLWKAIDEARGVGNIAGRESYAKQGGAPGAVFASDAHGVEHLRHDSSMPRVCDVLSFKTEPVPEEACLEWCAKANSALPSGLRILGRSPPLAKDFHAAGSCERRCYECFVPLSLLAPELASAAQSAAECSPGTRRQASFRKGDTTDRSLDAVELAKLKSAMRRLQGEHRFHNFATMARLGPGDTLARRWVFKIRARAALQQRAVVFSAEVDALLRGQLHAMVGILIAIQRGLLPEEYIEAALSDHTLVRVPAAPEGTALWERCVYSNRFHYLVQPLMDGETAAQWRHEAIDGLMDPVRAGTFESWFERELVPSVPSLLADFAAYTAYAHSMTSPPRAALCPGEVDCSVPNAYATVLRLLREAASSGKWPSIGTGREKVIDSATLSEHGGEGGSFTVGSMPPPLGTPAGNSLFPELALAAFELEQVLMPGRPPSSTIAINKQVRFLPHIDSGAGAGQGISLIVGLGTYSGGELVVEGTVHDIRYKPTEFCGWTQRHWTQPFEGERFSLVWFTPRGCEGAPGIKREWRSEALGPGFQPADVTATCTDTERRVPEVDKFVTLPGGFQLPTLAFGTFQLRGDQCQTAVTSALRAGYQLVDTASIYGNEEAVGAAVRHWELGEGEPVPTPAPLLLLSKCSPKEMGLQRARDAFEATLRRLDRTVLDVYLIHWPGKAKLAHSSSEHRQARHDTWRALEELFLEGRVRAIGVSNFTAGHLQQLIEDGVRVVPMINQVEAHPFFVPRDTVEFCVAHGIAVQAYSPLGGGGHSNVAKASNGEFNGTQLLLAHHEVRRVAAEVGHSPAQVLLRWGLQRGFALVTRSSEQVRIAENASIFDFALSAAQMAALDALQQDAAAQKFCWNPITVQ